MPQFYLLKIKLLDMPHAIWRRFVVPSNITLDQLHEVVQIVMGWHNSHLHVFIKGNQQYMSAMSLELGDENDSLLEDDYTLESLAPKKGAKIRYCYDFGDDWLHEIVVENVNYEDPAQSHPIYCVAGEKACPPEDCGGVYGYLDFCDAIADPKHPEHRNLKEWFGGKYDPNHFDLDAVNKRLGVGHSPKKKATKKAAKKTAKKKTKKSKPKRMWVRR